MGIKEQVAAWTPQDMAKRIDGIDWQAAQYDDPVENFKVTVLFYALEQMDPKQALRLLMKVIECKGLREVCDFNDPQEYFKVMADFEHLCLDGHPTDEVKVLCDE